LPCRISTLFEEDGALRPGSRSSPAEDAPTDHVTGGPRCLPVDASPREDAERTSRRPVGEPPTSISGGRRRLIDRHRNLEINLAPSPTFASMGSAPAMERAVFESLSCPPSSTSPARIRIRWLIERTATTNHTTGSAKTTRDGALFRGDGVPLWSPHSIRQRAGAPLESARENECQDHREHEPDSNPDPRS
jgi:hypothetical protein